MPLEEYTKVISECSICIMNHDRQQAVGNIISMIWMGSKVYLNEHNLVYQYFTNIGIKVYSIRKDLFSFKQNPFNEIDEEELSNNRKILVKYFGVENVLLKVKNIIREFE